jgi:hypothetical protein
MTKKRFKKYYWPALQSINETINRIMFVPPQPFNNGDA